MLLVLGLLLTPTSEGASPLEEPSPTAKRDGEIDWLVIGNFKGATPTGLISRLGNWFFEYEQDDSLFRDLGDLGLGLGYTEGEIELDWDTFFRRRVVQSHRPLEPGDQVGQNDLSGYRNVDGTRSRVRVSYDYLPDVVGELDIGVQVEGGFSVTMARSRPSHIRGAEPLEKATLGSPREELKEFFEEYDVHGQRGLGFLTVASAGAVVDVLGGAIGKQTADTEKAAIFWDDYGKPIMAFTESGLPLKLRIFFSDDPTLTVGDTLTFTTFIGLSPIAAGIGESGLRASYRRFFRLLRETTVRKDPEDTVAIRVRNWYSHGGELTPLKFRPEVRLLFIKLGYTFFEAVQDRFGERVSDVTYRLDLKTQDGMELFAELIGQSGRLRVRPRLPTPEGAEGVDVLRSELQRGKTFNRRISAELFSWFRYRKRQIGSLRFIETADAEFREMVRVRSRELRSKIGRDVHRKMTSVIAAQSDIEWREGLEDEASLEGERLAVTITTNIFDRYARQRDVRSWISNIGRMLGFEEPHTLLSELEQAEMEGTNRFSAYLTLSFGPQEIDRLGSVTEDQIWLELAELLLGPEHREVWSTEGKRFWWEPDAPPNPRLAPSYRHPSELCDALRSYEKPAKRSRGFSAEEFGSRRLYRLATKTAKRFRRLQQVLVEESNCLKCLVSGYSSRTDVLLAQALAVRFAGGVETGHVGYDFQILMGDMVRPVGDTNGVAHGYQLPRGGEIVQNAETMRDSEPRLRAGQMLLNVSGTESDSNAGMEPCWKLRLYSDLLFADDMHLRINWRETRAGTDATQSIVLVDLGEAQVVGEDMREDRVGYVAPRGETPLSREYSVRDQVIFTTSGEPLAALGTPLQRARYYYDVPLPWPMGATSKESYTLLLRVLNRDGFPVSEEEEVGMRLPKDWGSRVPGLCLKNRQLAITADLETRVPLWDQK